MKVYLDLCVYNRPFDDQSQSRIALETLELILLLEKAIIKEINIVSSFTLQEENERTPFIDRKDKIKDMLTLASEYVKYSKEIEERAKGIEKLGIKGMDALHITCAEISKSDFLITCDDLLVKKVNRNKEQIKVNAISLIKFFVEEVFNK